MTTWTVYEAAVWAWVLYGGQWSDSGEWSDQEVWIDGPPWTAVQDADSE
jgi:hypothetical protein